MIKVQKNGVLLQKTDAGFEAEGVLNPAVIKEGDTIHLFYRAVAKGNYSTIGYCTLSSPTEIKERWDAPIIFPQHDYESKGVEDPRIVKIDGQFFLTYTGYDGINALGALATSKALPHFEKQGVIVPQITYAEFSHLAAAKGVVNEKYLRYNDMTRMHETHGTKILLWDKNVIFFPRRINGQLHILHRIRPDIQIVCVDELSELNPELWQRYFLKLDEAIVLTPKFKHEVSYIGGGCPPIETEVGWLLIYHGVHDAISGYVYCACAALLDLDHPQKEISRLPYPLFKPDEACELTGVVNNVCFPTGAIVEGDNLHIYYGAADEKIATATTSLSALLEELLSYKITNDKTPL